MLQQANERGDDVVTTDHDGTTAAAATRTQLWVDDASRTIEGEHTGWYDELEKGQVGVRAEPVVPFGGRAG